MCVCVCVPAQVKQACLVWQVCLFILIMTSKPNCVCVQCVYTECVCARISLCLCVCVAAIGETDIHNVLAYTMNLNHWVNFFVNDDNNSDFEGF